MPATLTALGVGFLISHEVEWLLTGIAALLGLCAVFYGWRRHGNRLVISTLFIGVVGLLVARGLEAGGHHSEHETAAVSATNSPDAHKGTEISEASHDSAAAHHDEGHVAIELLGVFAGLILCLGHIMNIREWRRSVLNDFSPASESHC